MRRIAYALAALIAGCGSTSNGPSHAPERCTEPPADPGVQLAWRHRRTPLLVTTQGSPHHSARDEVINPGAAFALRGKLAYGATSKDLEDEIVVAYLQAGGDCDAWSEVGRAATDDDGRVAIDVPAGALTTPGRHAFQLVVGGDRSRARGNVFVVERGRQAVVFDVDATLTTGDSEVFEEVLAGAEPDMRTGADRVAARYAERGYLVVYITGRPYMLAGATRRWLTARGLPPGVLRATDRVRDARPTEGGVGAYKLDALTELRDGPGLELRYAYGNAATDVCAYARAGVAPERTYIIGDHGGEACPGFAPSRALTDYPSHLPALRDLPAAR